MRKFITFLVIICGGLVCSAQTFPYVVYNTAGGNINVRDAPSTAGSFLCTVAPGSHLVAISQSGTWYQVYIPINGVGSSSTAWVSAGAGYMQPVANAAQVEVTGTNVLIRKTAGGNSMFETLWAYYPGYNYEVASTAISQRYYPTGNTQNISGTTWYEIDVPRSCYQCNTGNCSVAADFSIVTKGWISSQFLNYISPCTFTVSPTSQTYSATATTGSFSVNAGAGCAWQATVSCNWVQLTNTSGTGSGTLSFSVDENTSTSPRSCTITVESETYAITQSGATPCSYSVSPSSQTFSSAATNGSFSLTTSANCSWQASANCNWVHVTNTTGTGGATINFTVDENTTTNSRTCSITVNGQTFTVNQTAASSCSYTFNPTTQNNPVQGGANSFYLTTGASCTWSGNVSCNWVHLTNLSGTGSGSINYTVDQNTFSTSRTCFIVINSQSFTVTQDGTSASSCAYTLSATSISSTSAGTSQTINVTLTTGNNCSWSPTVPGNCSWVQVSNAGSQTGSGSFTVTISPNTDSSPRSCQIDVTGTNQSIAVTQAGAGGGNCANPLATPQLSINGCQLSVSPLANVIYQWYYNNQPIAASNSNTFNATSGNGSYYVLVTSLVNSACTAQSASINLNCSVGISELTATNIVVFPNPANEILNISYENQCRQPATFQLLDVSGRLLLQKTEAATPGKQTLTVYTKQLAVGMYILKMQIAQQSNYYKIQIN